MGTTTTDTTRPESDRVLLSIPRDAFDSHCAEAAAAGAGSMIAGDAWHAERLSDAAQAYREAWASVRLHAQSTDGEEPPPAELGTLADARYALADAACDYLCAIAVSDAVIDAYDPDGPTPEPEWVRELQG
jgi:hypothetical protein